MKQREPTVAEIEATYKRGKAEMASGAAAVRYDRSHDALILTMQSGAVATIPRELIPVVADAVPEAALDLELSPMGTSLRFPRLDADFAVQGLIRLAFGVNEANRVAGATKSSARAAASRQNGRKGGRPRKESDETVAAKGLEWKLETGTRRDPRSSVGVRSDRIDC